jgi:hypothetical protein
MILISLNDESFVEIYIIRKLDQKTALKKRKWRIELRNQRKESKDNKFIELFEEIIF